MKNMEILLIASLQAPLSPAVINRLVKCDDQLSHQQTSIEKTKFWQCIDRIGVDRALVTDCRDKNLTVPYWEATRQERKAYRECFKQS